MKNKNDIVVDDELIARYLGGEALPEEAEALMDWIEEPFNHAHFEKIQATWDATFPAKSRVTFSNVAAWEKIQDSVQPAPRRSSAGVWYRIAAGLVIGLSAGLLAYFLYQQNNPAPLQVSVVTSKNARSVTLPDSSRVVVNRNSTLSYPEGFGKKSREVNFSGEAFFSVQQDVSKPFIVHTPVANIKVVGTQFNVRSTGNALEVNVQEGKILVYTSMDSVFLEAGNSALLEAGKSATVRKTIDPNQWGYASRKFVFQDVPLAEVFESIEKAYPYTIEVANKDIKNCRLTAVFDHVSAQEMLNLIGETLDLTVQENDSTFRVEGKGCPWVQ